jgi:hypothetical protein
MARNDIPRSPNQIIGLGTKMHTGLVDYGTQLRITQITPVDFQSELDDFIDGYNKFNTARSAQQTASNAFTAADLALTDWEGVTRNILAGRFGNRWSTMWAQAGFISPSTAVPKRIQQRLGLALSLKSFFTANPTYEVPAMEVTAAQATALRIAAVAAQNTLKAAKVDLKNKKDVFDVAFIAMTDTMKALVKILGATLVREDPRWLAFGLQMPATNNTPGQPLNVTAGMDESGNIIPQCDPVALATRYRWRMLIVGVETDYSLVASTTQPFAVIPGILPGQRVQIIVQAVNNNMQGVASDPIVFNVPFDAQAKTATSEPLSLSVKEGAISATEDGAKNRTKGHRLPAIS